MAIQVSDSVSNRNEQIENAAKAIGQSARKRAVFEAIHHHKKPAKTVTEISQRTKLTRIAVLQAGGELARKLGLEQVKVNGEVAYKKSDFLQQHKNEVLSLAGNKTKLANYPTKRNPGRTKVKVIQVPVSTADAVQITIDDIGNFSRVRKLASAGYLPSDLSEKTFKKGIQAILGEPGAFTDWGGERNDLLSTRMSIDGKRRTVAFAFKGPGTKGALTPGKMGKNGDQIQRLLQSSADVFIVQYWQEINESVLEQLRALATAKSATSGKKVWFGIVDGFDSRRIYDAYKAKFLTSARKKKVRAPARRAK